WDRDDICNDQSIYSGWLWKVDQKITARNTAGFSYNSRVNNEVGDNANWWGDLASPPLPSWSYGNQAYDWAWYDTHIFSPNVVNEFRMGWYQNSFHVTQNEPSSKILGDLGIDLGADSDKRGSYAVVPNL